MNDGYLEKIIKKCEASLLYSFHYRDEGVEISFSKGRESLDEPLIERNQYAADNQVALEDETIAAADMLQPGKVDKDAEANMVIIKSSFVGILSLSDKLVGTDKIKVKKGEVLGTIEAMKIYNDIISPVDGAVERVLVDNGSLVECEQELIQIKVG